MDYMLIVFGIVVLALGSFGGYEKARADWQASRADAAETQVTALKRDNKDLTDHFNGLQADVDHFRKLAATAQARAAAAQADADKWFAADQEVIARMAQILKREPSNTHIDGATCARADSILDGLITDSMRD